VLIVQFAETLAVTERFAVAEPANAGTEIRLRTARERIVRFICVFLSVLGPRNIRDFRCSQFRGGTVSIFEDRSDLNVRGAREAPLA